MPFKKTGNPKIKTAISTTIQLFILLCSSGYAFAQNGLFLSGSLGIGEATKKQFEQGGSVLQNKWATKGKTIVIPFNYELNLAYHFRNHFGVSFNMKIANLQAVFHDGRFIEQHGIQEAEYTIGELEANAGNFNVSRRYLSPGVAAKYFINTQGDGNGLFFSAGIGVSRAVGDNTPILSYLHEPTNELLELRMRYKRLYTYEYLEIGYVRFLKGYPNSGKKAKPMITTKGFTFNVALRYTFAGTYATADYQSRQNNAIQYTDKLTLNGSYFSVVASAGIGIFGRQIDRASERIHQRKQEEEETARREQEAENEEIRNRDVNLKQEIVVRNTKITLSVWDDLKYDKDVITVDLNGAVLLENYTLKTFKKTIELTLDKESNTLVLYAISEGREKPCTVALLIDDGITQQKIILNSSLAVSEAIAIRLEE